MTSLPLVTHKDLRDVIAWRHGAPVTVAHFLADVHQLAQALPQGRHVLNACADRYRFTVGLAAALVADKISLLPPTLTPEMVRQLKGFAPDVFCLTDQHLSIGIQQLSWLGAMASGPRTECLEVPMIPASRALAVMFTSGSTGVPLAQRKTWGSVVRSVRAEALCLGLLDGRRHSIVATVPPQHMYGLESTVLVALQSGAAMDAAHPFYPADICSALAATPRPSILVTTPTHLKVLLASGLDIPAPDLVLSATAPMPPQLAIETEARLNAPLLEIYGSTETGQIAWRRTTRTAEWTLFPGVSLQAYQGRIWAAGGHVGDAVAMADELELVHGGGFRLHGRTADLINIAGKRSSLGYLNHQLNAIPGVVDGAFFMPDDSGHEEVVRLMAFAVAPGLETSHLMTALRQRIDALFMPRPMVLLDCLPRNSTGKLPRSTLEALANEYRKKVAAHAP
jgi:acyl-coenzyme A synthetase/AMP-(fatty) acid ligase